MFQRRDLPIAMLTLPEDVVVHILSFLSIVDILNTSLVSKKLHELSNNDLVWKYLFHKEWHFFPGKLGKDYFKSCLEIDERWQTGGCVSYKISKVGQLLKSVHLLGNRINESKDLFSHLLPSKMTQMSAQYVFKLVQV